LKREIATVLFPILAGRRWYILNTSITTSRIAELLMELRAMKAFTVAKTTVPFMFVASSAERRRVFVIEVKAVLLPCPVSTLGCVNVVLASSHLLSFPFTR